jgi:nicotinamide-nucleotide amidase
MVDQNFPGGVPVKAEIIAIGRELLDGSQVDTNTAYIGSRLWALGVDVVRSTLVPDEPRIIEEVLERALDSAGMVVTTGGLGTTSDDRTKHVVARLFGRNLVMDENALANVQAHFENIGLAMPEINLTQAMVPEGARIIENERGTAPGLVLEREGALLFVLPGVPSEMRAMVEHYLVPFLEGRGFVRLAEERILRTTGLPESSIAEEIGDLATRLARVEVAYLPSVDGVDIKVIGRGDSAAQAMKTADRAADRLADRLGDAVYASGAESMEEIVGYLLAMRKKTVAVAESCTGGRLGWRLTRIPGSSDYFVGGVVAYSNDLKKRLLGVKAGTLKASGAVSREVAIEMADGVRQRGRADYGVSITGTAGPGGGTDEKPVGLVYVAVASGRRRMAEEYRFSGGRGTVRRAATQAALNLLRLELLRGKAR